MVSYNCALDMWLPSGRLAGTGRHGVSLVGVQEGGPRMAGADVGRLAVSLGAVVVRVAFEQLVVGIDHGTHDERAGGELAGVEELVGQVGPVGVAVAGALALGVVVGRAVGRPRAQATGRGV